MRKQNRAHGAFAADLAVRCGTVGMRQPGTGKGGTGAATSAGAGTVRQLLSGYLG